MQVTQAQLMSRIATEAGFAQWFATKFMEENLPEFHAAFPREKRVAAAVRARRIATHLGFTDPSSHTHFAALMWRVAANFFMFPGYRQIASDRAADGPSRIDRFYTEVTADQAADAILKGQDWLLFASPFDDEESP